MNTRHSPTAQRNKLVHSTLTPALLSLLVAACSSSPMEAPSDNAAAPIPPSLEAQAEARVHVDAEGHAHPLMPVSTREPTPAPIAEITISPMRPSRVMLDEKGYITPPRDQGQRGTCQTFATVGVIESEYLRQYGIGLDLSEEYLVNMFNESGAPNWTGGDGAHPLLAASYYALPTETAWPYISNENTVINAVDTAAGLTPGSVAARAFYDSEYLGPQLSLLHNEIANYNTLVYPSSAAHAGAKYGPMPGAYSGIALNGTDPAPLEAVLAAGHAIAFTTSPEAWNYPSTSGGTFTDNGAALTGDHIIMLVGYDAPNRIFRIKNSWGAGWNGSGFANFSYDLVMRTIQAPAYVTSLRNPNAPPNVGTGAIRGFWSGVLNGVPGVAVIHHATPSGIPGWPSITPEAGDFHGVDGSVVPMNWAGGNYNSATFTIGSAASLAQTITLGGGPSAWSYGAWGANGNYVEGGTWCRTSASTLPADLTPDGYASMLADPYVFPSGTCTPSGRAQSAPAIAVASSGWAYVAQRRADDSLWISAAQPGTAWWTSQIAGPGTTFSRPSISIRANYEVDIAVQGPANSLVFYSNTENFGATWQKTSVTGPGTTFSEPALFVRSTSGYPANEMDIAAQGPNGSLMYYWNQGGGWGQAMIGFYETTVGAPAMFVRDGGEADIVVQGANNSLLEYSATPGQSFLTRTIAGNGTTFSSPAIVVRAANISPANEADVVAQGPNNSLLYYFNRAGGGWSGSFLVAGSRTTFGAPSIAVRASGEVDVASQGVGGSLMYYSATPGSAWSTTQVSGPGTALSSPSMAVRRYNPSNEADIVVQGPSGTPTYNWNVAGTGWYSAGL